MNDGFWLATIINSTGSRWRIARPDLLVLLRDINRLVSPKIEEALLDYGIFPFIRMMTSSLRRPFPLQGSINPISDGERTLFIEWMPWGEAILDEMCMQAFVSKEM